MAKYYDLKAYTSIAISNCISGLVGMAISIILNGGWMLVVWFPWVSRHEVSPTDMTNIYGLAIYYALAFVLSVVIEAFVNSWRLKDHEKGKIYKATLYANLISYAIGSTALYSYSF